MLKKTNTRVLILRNTHDYFIFTGASVFDYFKIDDMRVILFVKVYRMITLIMFEDCGVKMGEFETLKMEVKQEEFEPMPRAEWPEVMTFEPTMEEFASLSNLLNLMEAKVCQNLIFYRYLSASKIKVLKY